MEIKRKTLTEDYIDFIKALQKKFKFKNVKAFENDFLKFIDGLKKATEQDKINEQFFLLLNKHTSLSEEEIANGVFKEMEMINGRRHS